MILPRDPKIIVALDENKQASAWHLIEQLDPSLCRLKIGKEMFTRFGPDFVKQVIKKDFDVFLDLKYHDIPNTVAGACEAAADLGVWMLNVHASGGRKMLEATMNRLVQNTHVPLVVAVTVLTSLNVKDMYEVGYRDTPQAHVSQLARLAAECGLNGVVCSALEASTLRKTHANDFLLVTPGIRLNENPQDDQARITTPTNAISQGASYLVIGRPITQASDPMQALISISQMLLSR